MKFNLKFAAMIILFTFSVFAGCGGDGITAGDKITFTADGVSFVMAYVPGGLTFSTGVNDDDGDETVSNAYWIGDTEVTYELWQKVYDWAVNGTGGATGEGQYTFANEGTMGDGTEDTNQHPVTTINWRDSMVWCNALTEWYNAQKGTSYSCVYFTDIGYTTTHRSSADGIYSSSVNSNAGSFDAPYIKADATGFRMLSSNEWELAARYRDGTLWTYGDHVSGDDSGACYNDGSTLDGLSLSTVFGDYAVYSTNSGSSTAAVKSKTYNALGIHDMSGNVWEWCFDWSTGSARVERGGSWYEDEEYQRVGIVDSYVPYAESDIVGFRFANSNP